MNKFYFAELQNANSYRKAELLKATNLTAAKREASKKRAFYGTVLEIGTEISSEGFILAPISQKHDHEKWQDVKLI